MKYMGSKNRIAKYILPIILKDRGINQWYVEPFFGGGNSMQHVEGKRLGGEANFFIASMWNKLINGWTPETITREQYQYIKNTDDPIDEHVIGWTATACSYSGKWFGGFAGKVATKGGLRDYQAEAFANVRKQLPKLKGVEVIGCSYNELIIPPNSIIYSDPPYWGTTQYKDVFNSAEHFEWCRQKSKQGHLVFISEYTAPDDFVCVWQQEVKSSLSANGKAGGNKVSIEKLFVHKSQLNKDK